MPHSRSKRLSGRRKKNARNQTRLKGSRQNEGRCVSGKYVGKAMYKNMARRSIIEMPLLVTLTG